MPDAAAGSAKLPNETIIMYMTDVRAQLQWHNNCESGTTTVGGRGSNTCKVYADSCHRSQTLIHLSSPDADDALYKATLSTKLPGTISTDSEISMTCQPTI